MDGNDPKWIAKRDATIGKPTNSEVNCKGRFVDNDELKYSLRSVERYAPWIRKIFIVTYQQKPKWLDTFHPKIQIVDHTEIMPREILPCFNSVIIEHHIHRIPGLSEHFIFSNDDMFINRPVTPETFFGKNHLPIVRLNYLYVRKYFVWFKQHVLRRRLNSYATTIHNAATLVEKRFGNYYYGRTHHNMDAYLKSNYNLARELFRPEIDATLMHHKREETDIQRNLYSYVALATHCAHRQYVTQKTSFRLRIDKHKLYQQFLKYNPIFFCLNDSQYSNDYDRQCAKEFLSKYFPEKSQFEK